MIADIITGAVNGLSGILFGIYDRAEDKNRYDQDRTTALEVEQRQYQEAQKNRDFQAGESQKNRDFQERMSSTAYQRANQDMLKAGLNPALMYGSGAKGAQAMSGSTASGSQGSASAPGSRGAPVSTPQLQMLGLTQLASTAMDIKLKKEQLDLVKAKNKYEKEVLDEMHNYKNEDARNRVGGRS